MGNLPHTEQELCSKHYTLHDRCRLFDATVTPTLLYGCAAWALTAKMEQALKTQRRKMLRYVFRLHRRRDEAWVQYVQRSAHDVDIVAEKQGMRDWVATYRLRKWRFAGALARKNDNRWSSLLMSWKPADGAGRARARPFTRWSTDFDTFAGGSWIEHAKDEAAWAANEDLFAKRP